MFTPIDLVKAWYVILRPGMLSAPWPQAMEVRIEKLCPHSVAA